MKDTMNKRSLFFQGPHHWRWKISWHWSTDCLIQVWMWPCVNIWY